MCVEIGEHGINIQSFGETIQAYFRDIADLVPNHFNKVNVTVKLVTRNF